ncbi:MAG: tetratricopeptide repeat protein [Bacteroidales bacterium]|nr:tetratricopeptide repeat protein [Bacteroidales bacterium]
MQQPFRKGFITSTLFGLLTIAVVTVFAQNNQSGNSDEYEKLIEQADDLLQDKQYGEALELYQNALSMDAGNNYAAKMIDSVNRIIESRKTFEKVMTQAAEHHRNKNYKKAKDLYEKAIKLNPDAEFPKYKLEQIREVYTDPEELAAYNNAIEKADNYFDNGKFEKAITKYEEAAGIMPDKSYAGEMIAKSKIRLKEYKKIKARYDSLINQADRLYANDKLENAKSVYQQALDLRIENAYPEKRISTIDSITTAREARDQAYKEALQRADSLYVDQRFAEAKTAYQEALKIKPEERYPGNMLSRIDEKILEMKDRGRKYEEAITDADDLLASGKLEDALIMYKKAKNLKPSEEYPKQKIASINEQLDAIAAKENKYDSLVSEGDEAYTANAYKDAKGFYSQALELKPQQTHPQDRLTVIDSILTARQVKAENYEDAIAAADQLFNEKSYEKAKANYRAALGIKPEATYPQQKIDEIDKLQKELAEKQKKYNNLITEADKLFEAEQYDQAKEIYKTASGVLPDNTYPEEKAAAIDSIFKARKERQANFEEALAKADQYYEAENYTDAREKYEEALEYKPGNQHAQKRFNNADAIIKERQRAKQEAYDKAIANADRLYQMRVYDKAMEAFRKAQSIKSGESYPGTMIDKIKESLDSQSVLDLVEQNMVIEDATEKKLSFEPLAASLRNNNFIRLKLKKTGDSNPKLFINYGKGDRKNGGVVINNIDNDQTDDYIINLSEQDRWFRLENNWISLYPEGGDVEISLIQISTSE